MAGPLIRLLGHGEKLPHIDRWVLVLELKLLHPPEQRGLDKCELFASGTLVRLVANSLEQQANSCLVKQSPCRLYSSLYWAQAPGCLEVFPFFSRLINPDRWSWKFLRLLPKKGDLDCRGVQVGAEHSRGGPASADCPPPWRSP